MQAPKLVYGRIQKMCAWQENWVKIEKNALDFHPFTNWK